jgi:hypothetical protein
MSTWICDERVSSIQPTHNLVTKLRTTALLSDKKYKHKAPGAYRYLPSPRDSLFWGCLWVKVYSINLRTEELKENRLFLMTQAIFLQNSFNVWTPERLPTVRGMSTCRDTAFSTPPMICELLTTFRTLSAVGHADSSAKFVCASQSAAYRSPWSEDPCKGSTK